MSYIADDNFNNMVAAQRGLGTGNLGASLAMGATPTTTLQPFQILLVEDSLTQAVVIIHELRQHYPSLQFQQASSLREARLAISLMQSFDLIVLDVRLPDGSGFELCQELKNTLATSRIPVVMFSESNLVQMGQEAIAAGADYCVSKDGGTVGGLTLQMLVSSLMRDEQLS